MMVSIVKSFAHGNAIIAEVLPRSTSTLINNKLWGLCRGDGSRLKIKGIEKNENKNRETAAQNRGSRQEGRQDDAKRQ